MVTKKLLMVSLKNTMVFTVEGGGDGGDFFKDVTKACLG